MMALSVQKRVALFFVVGLLISLDNTLNATSPSYKNISVLRKLYHNYHEQSSMQEFVPQSTLKSTMVIDSQTTTPAESDTDKGDGLFRHILKNFKQGFFKQIFGQLQRNQSLQTDLGGVYEETTAETANNNSKVNSYGDVWFFHSLPKIPRLTYARLWSFFKTSFSLRIDSSDAKMSMPGKFRDANTANLPMNNSSQVDIETHDFLHLDTDNVTECLLEKEGLLVFPASDGVVSFSNLNSTAPDGVCCGFWCTVVLTAPFDKVLLLAARFSDTDMLCHRQNLQILQVINGSKDNLYELCNNSPMEKLAERVHQSQHAQRRFSAPGADIILRIKLFSFNEHVSFRINFNLLPLSAVPVLDGVFTSKMAGYIQTPGFDQQTKHLLPMDSWMKVAVPANHTIMVSFPYIDMLKVPILCSEKLLQFYVGSMSEEGLRMTACSLQYTKPTVYHTDAIYVRSTSSKHIILTLGFRMLFSMHNYSAQPERLSYDMWNCSVYYWSDFSQHFPCNLYPNCNDARDEIDCPYFSTHCGKGNLDISGHCFTYIPPHWSSFKLSWMDAERQCRGLNMRLAVFSAPEIWNKAMEILRYEESNFVYIGLKSSSGSVPSIYKKCLQFVDGTIAYFTGKANYELKLTFLMKPFCLSISSGVLSPHVDCDVKHKAGILCEIQNKIAPETPVRLKPLQLSKEKLHFDYPHSIVQCPAGHVTYDFLACDMESMCWARSLKTSVSCPAPMSPLPPMFLCDNSIQYIPYSLVCNHRPDCKDGSDEIFCELPTCDYMTNIRCDNGECAPKKWCDDVSDCMDGSDEKECPLRPMDPSLNSQSTGAVIDFVRTGGFVMEYRNDTFNSSSPSLDLCPDSHFSCPGTRYCYPVYVRCNGVFDCPDHEDEAMCDSYHNPGFYRCRASRVHVHPIHMCDGMDHCPQRDDELYCHFVCPQNCTCYGVALFCSVKFEIDMYPQLRFVDASGSNRVLDDFGNSFLLIYLSLARCKLKKIKATTFPNLRSLDLSDNHLTVISEEHLLNIPKLRHLLLAGNPLLSFFTRFLGSKSQFSTLLTLSMARVYIPHFKLTAHKIFPNLRLLNLSDCGTEYVSDMGFSTFENLQVLDLRGCPLTFFSKHIFQGLEFLEEVFADNYKLCCPSVMPTRLSLSQCSAPADEISSCDALLRSNVYRGFLFFFALLTLMGNFSSFVFRTIIGRDKVKRSFDIFVSNLSIADFLMGVYLSVIGVADSLYRGSYLWNDVAWRFSISCKMAGFLSLLSNEVSAFTIWLITLDRFLILKFSFSKLHFTKGSALIASGVAWCAGLTIAAIPLLPWNTHWQFYSRNGICIPLPISRNNFPGQQYSFGIMIVFNFVLFVMIAVGQIFVYWSIQENKMHDANTITRRLTTIVMSDFLCWFPIGLLGLIASAGYPVSGEFNVAIAIFALPLNSAINPFLYTFNILLENRRHRIEKRIRQSLMTQIQSELKARIIADPIKALNLHSDQLFKHFEGWLKRGIMPKEEIARLLITNNDCSSSDPEKSNQTSN